MIDVGSGQDGSIRPLEREPVLATRPFQAVGDPEEAPIRVIVTPGILREIERHLASDVNTELGGVLIGQACLWQDQTYVEVGAFVPAESPSRSSVHFTFTTETWIALTQLVEDRFPDSYMVGWYHSHPRLGVFFSAQDNDVHRVVFNQPWHVALVLDPSAAQAGFFGWIDGRLARLPGYYLLEDLVEPAPEAPEPSPEAASLEEPAPTKAPLRHTRLLTGSSLLLLGAAIWILSRFDGLQRELQALQHRQEELASELSTLRAQLSGDAVPPPASKIGHLTSGLTMQLDGDDVSDAIPVPAGTEVRFEWTLSNPSTETVDIRNTGLQVALGGVARPDLFVQPEDAGPLPASLEPGESMTVEGRLTPDESGLYTVSVVVLTSSATEWQTPSAEDGSPAMRVFRSAPP
jgi:proteasome lid subunit RPN8/RPN11